VQRPFFELWVDNTRLSQMWQDQAGTAAGRNAYQQTVDVSGKHTVINCRIKCHIVG